MRIAAFLDIPFLTFDFEDVYKKEVADYMITEYKKGRTPNPDVMCNKEVKFGAFLKKALSMSADFVATGHYAQDKKMVLSHGSHSILNMADRALVANAEENTSFYLALEKTNWITEQPKENKIYTAQIRYHGEFFPCKIICARPSLAQVVFEKPILVASGQSVVVYDGDVCLGGGVVV